MTNLPIPLLQLKSVLLLELLQLLLCSGLSICSFVFLYVVRLTIRSWSLWQANLQIMSSVSARQPLRKLEIFQRQLPTCKGHANERFGGHKATQLHATTYYTKNNSQDQQCSTHIQLLYSRRVKAIQLLAVAAVPSLQPRCMQPIQQMTL